MPCRRRCKGPKTCAAKLEEIRDHSQTTLPEFAALVILGDIRGPEWAETARSIKNDHHERRPSNNFSGDYVTLNKFPLSDIRSDDLLKFLTTYGYSSK